MFSPLDTTVSFATRLASPVATRISVTTCVCPHVEPDRQRRWCRPNLRRLCLYDRPRSFRRLCRSSCQPHRPRSYRRLCRSLCRPHWYRLSRYSSRRSCCMLCRTHWHSLCRHRQTCYSRRLYQPRRSRSSRPYRHSSFTCSYRPHVMFQFPRSS